MLNRRLFEVKGIPAGVKFDGAKILVQPRWDISKEWSGAKELADRLNISPTVAQILYNRGISTFERAKNFLNPKLNGLTEPDDIPDLPKAARRIREAIEKKQKIIIYGDYDVDGVTGCAILWHIIFQAGGIVEVYVPHRVEEGYGLNKDAIKKLAQQDTKLLITVDCGIRDHQCVEYARERNLDVIITDHHEPEENGTFPNAYAILHPDLATDKPSVNPCGAAVAFKLAWAIAREISSGQRVDAKYREMLIELTSLVALATIADVVPLIDENRILVKFGLNQLNQTSLEGMRALLKVSHLEKNKIESYHAAFVIGPRLNAAGRMGHARQAFELLTTSNLKRAQELAEYLEKQNKARQKLEERITAEAISLAEYQGQLVEQIPILVLAKENWHAGVIGIVASKLVDRLNKPVVMIALDGDYGQGSARSIEGYDINEGLTYCKDYLLSYGGHAMAAGLRIEAGKVMHFMKALQEHASRYLSDRESAPILKIDAMADPAELDLNFVWQMNQLGPFGHGNPRPVLATDFVELVGTPRCIGQNGKHLTFSIKWGERVFRIIAFNQAKQYEKLLDYRRCQIAFEPIVDEYRGGKCIQLRAKNIRFESE